MAGEPARSRIFHYVVGVCHGLLLVAVSGARKLQEPGIAAPLILASALLILRYFVMMPRMGMRMAASRTPKPAIARLNSVAGHAVFGGGMYLTARLMDAVA